MFKFQISAFPLHLYRVEIQDTANEGDAIVCYVNQPVDMQSRYYPSLITKQYIPPFDRAFNATKLIWDEMALFILFGMNILCLISLNLLQFYNSASTKSKDQTPLYWTQVLFTSGVPALVTLLFVASYRVFTKLRPQYRKISQKMLTLCLGTTVVVISKY